MKKLVMVMMAVGMFGAMPVLAEEKSDMKMNVGDDVRQCALQAETIQQKISRIQGEIDKGSTKYSAEELRKLKAKLKDANDTLDSLVR